MQTGVLERTCIQKSPCSLPDHKDIVLVVAVVCCCAVSQWFWEGCFCLLGFSFLLLLFAFVCLEIWSFVSFILFWH